jgi:CRISPR/Cas system CSM-associated protein Csm3 (group 7 of RAMP superfamily)
MKSIAIDPYTANFVRENGRLRYTKTELEFTAQKVRHELSLFLGEWFIDPEMGLPYLPGSIKKSEHRTVLESAIRAKLISIEDVNSIIEFNPRYDKSERLLEVAFVLDTKAGKLDSNWPAAGGIS